MRRPDPPGPDRRAEAREGIDQIARDLLFRSLRWIGRHVRGFYAAVGLYLFLAFALMLVGTAAFAGIAELVEEGLTRSVDEAILLWLHAHGSGALDVAALEVTSLGSTLVVVIVILASSAFLWMSGHTYSVALLWVAAAGSQVLNSVLKGAFDRPRPQLFEWVAPHAGFASFPSGHAMTSMVVYGTLAYLVVRLEPTRWMRRFTLFFAAVVILMIGLSRLYLGVHYPSDILAGFAVGFVWASFCALGIEVIRYFRGRKPDVGEKEKGLNQGMSPVRDAQSSHRSDAEA